MTKKEAKELNRIISELSDSITVLQSPRWETPEQYRERTGEPWPDEAPAWERYVSPNSKGFWELKTYDEAKDNAETMDDYGLKTEIVLATEAGPPPDDWKPEAPGAGLGGCHDCPGGPQCDDCPISPENSTPVKLYSPEEAATALKKGRILRNAKGDKFSWIKSQFWGMGFYREDKEGNFSVAHDLSGLYEEAAHA